MTEETKPELDLTIEELLAKVEQGNEGWQRLKEFFPELDFTEELKEKPKLWEHLRRAISAEAPKVAPPLSNPDAPKLNDDFSNYFVINNLPQTEEAKVAKLEALIKTVFSKRDITIDDDAIDM